MRAWASGLIVRDQICTITLLNTALLSPNPPPSCCLALASSLSRGGAPIGPLVCSSASSTAARGCTSRRGSGSEAPQIEKSEAIRGCPRDVRGSSVLAKARTRAPARPEQPTSDLRNLTVRELEVMRLVAEGLSTKEVASKLGVSTRTAESHRAAVMAKLGLHRVSERPGSRTRAAPWPEPPCRRATNSSTRAGPRLAPRSRPSGT